MALTSIVDSVISRIKEVLDPIPFVDATGAEGVTLGDTNSIYTYKVSQPKKPRTYIAIYENDAGAPITIQPIESHINKVIYSITIAIFSLVIEDNTTISKNGLGIEQPRSREEQAAKDIRYLREQIMNRLVAVRNDSGASPGDPLDTTLRFIDSDSPAAEGTIVSDGYLRHTISLTLHKTAGVQ